MIPITVPRAVAAATGGLPGADRKDPPGEAACLGGGPDSPEGRTHTHTWKRHWDQNGNNDTINAMRTPGVQDRCQRHDNKDKEITPLEYYYSDNNKDPPGNEETETAAARGGVGGGWSNEERRMSS
eukprot:jgi/Psemu1/14019/gm1.14019_g